MGARPLRGRARGHRRKRMGNYRLDRAKAAEVRVAELEAIFLDTIALAEWIVETMNKAAEPESVSDTWTKEDLEKVDAEAEKLGRILAALNESEEPK